MKFKHAAWRRLYREEQGSFARLPWFVRAAASEMLKVCDDAGRIDVGPLEAWKKGTKKAGQIESPADALARAIAFRMGATVGDRRLMHDMFPELFTEGYLVYKDPFVIIRNFVAAQRRWDEGGDEDASPDAKAIEPSEAIQARPPPDAGTNSERTTTESSTSAERVLNESSTRSELSTRKHTSETPSARARAFSSVLSSSDQRRGEENSPETEPPETEPIHPPLQDTPDQTQTDQTQTPERTRTTDRPPAPDRALAPYREKPNRLDDTDVGNAFAKGGGNVIEYRCPAGLKLAFLDALTEMKVTLQECETAAAFLAAGGAHWARRERFDVGWFMRDDGARLTELFTKAGDWHAEHVATEERRKEELRRQKEIDDAPPGTYVTESEMRLGMARAARVGRRGLRERQLREALSAGREQQAEEIRETMEREALEDSGSSPVITRDTLEEGRLGT